MVQRGRIFARLLSTKRYTSKHEKPKYIPKYFRPNQLEATPIISDSPIIQAEEELFNSTDDSFAEMFRMHPTMLNIEERTVLAKEMRSPSLHYYDIGHKDTFSSPSSLSNLPAHETNIEVLQRMSKDLKDNENKESIEKTINQLQAFSDTRDDKVPLKIKKSTLELVKGRLVALPSKNQERKVSEIEKASLFMLYQSLISNVILPGRVLKVEAQRLEVSVGTVIRSLPISMVIPSGIRVYLNMDQRTVDEILKGLLYQIVHVKVRNKPSIEFPGVEVETAYFEKAVADNRVCLTLGAWANPGKYDLLPSGIKKLVSVTDYNGYQAKYSKSYSQNRARPLQ